MEQKVNSINRLKRMGYLVSEDDGIVWIALRTGSGMAFRKAYPEIDFIYFNGDIVEIIVAEFNGYFKSSV